MRTPICEHAALTDSSGYDLLIGTWASYPSGLSVDRWAEEAVYRADWAGKGLVIDKLQMRLHQEKGTAWEQLASGGSPRRA
jgi:hypothetical protein